MNQALKPPFLHLRQPNPLRNHLMRPQTPLGQRIQHLLEIPHRIRRNAHIRPFLEIKIIRLDRARLLPDRDIDNAASRARGVHRFVQRGLHARAVEDDVCAFAVCQFARAGDDVGGRGVDDEVCAEFLRKGLPLRAYFGDDDALAAFRFEREDGRDADGAAAEDEGHVAGLEGADFDRVPAHG